MGRRFVHLQRLDVDAILPKCPGIGGVGRSHIEMVILDFGLAQADVFQVREHISIGQQLLHALA